MQANGSSKEQRPVQNVTIPLITATPELILFLCLCTSNSPVQHIKWEEGVPIEVLRRLNVVVFDVSVLPTLDRYTHTHVWFGLINFILSLQVFLSLKLNIIHYFCYQTTKDDWITTNDNIEPRHLQAEQETFTGAQSTRKTWTYNS